MTQEDQARDLDIPRRGSSDGPQLRRHRAPAAWPAPGTRQPYLGTLGVALALQAALVAGLWLLVPVLVFLAWSWNAGEPEAVFVAVGLGLIGTAWTTIGISLIPLSPGSFLLPGAAWIVLALLMAVASAVARRRGSKGL